MTKRDPHADNEMIDEMQKERAPSQSGSSGGNMARAIGSRDEENTATGSDPEVTRVHKGDKANSGAAPLPRDRTNLGGR